MKNQNLLILFFLSALITSCSSDSIDVIFENNKSQVNFDLTMDGYSLVLDAQKTSSKLRAKSDFTQVFESSISLILTNNEQSKEVIINPSSQDNISLVEYGQYAWELVGGNQNSALSDFIPIFGSSNNDLNIDQPMETFQLLVESKFALVTISTEFVSEAVLVYQDQELVMPAVNGLFYGYINTDLNDFSLRVKTIGGGQYSSPIIAPQVYSHYSYSLQLNSEASFEIILLNTFDISEVLFDASFIDDFSDCVLDGYINNGQGTIQITQEGQNGCGIQLTELGSEVNNFYPDREFSFGEYHVSALADNFISDNVIFLFAEDAPNTGLAFVFRPNGTDNPGFSIEKDFEFLYFQDVFPSEIVRGDWYDIDIIITPALLKLNVNSELLYEGPNFLTAEKLSGLFKLGVANSGKYDNLSYIPYY